MPKSAHLGEFEQHVLAALLRLRGNAYGVTIRREIVERTGRDVAVGAIYATLDRLEAKGYVSSRLGESTPERGSSRAASEKKVYVSPSSLLLDE